MVSKNGNPCYPKSLPGDITYLDTDNTVVSTTNSLNFSESGWWGRILSAMKVLIPILIGLLVVGCEKGGEITIGIPPKAKPVKELTLREKVIGTYELELKKFGETQRYVLLDNSTVEYYLNGKKEEAEHKWSIVDKEVHIERENRAVSVFSINKDESITGIARIDEDGKRKEILKEHQYTRKKTK